MNLPLMASVKPVGHYSRSGESLSDLTGAYLKRTHDEHSQILQAQAHRKHLLKTQDRPSQAYGEKARAISQGTRSAKPYEAELMHTEKEAVALWCPHVRIGRVPNASVNRDATTTKVTSASCIGSQCMAWRWEPSHRQYKKSRAGYCGLSGAPSQ